MVEAAVAVRPVCLLRHDDIEREEQSDTAEKLTSSTDQTTCKQSLTCPVSPLSRTPLTPCCDVSQITPTNYDI